MPDEPIPSPDDPRFVLLARQLAGLADELCGDDRTLWPAEQLQLCAAAGLFGWFVPRERGGAGWSEAELARAYLELGAACLTTTFVITQLAGGIRRVANGAQGDVLNDVLPELIAGRKLATVAISHLTTSRRHLAKPVLRAEEIEGGFLLDGYSPWVTGSTRADFAVLGATLADGRQILVCLPIDAPGVVCPPAQRLVALSASQTGEVRCEGVRIDRGWLLAGPTENVMAQGSGAMTGGLQTSTLAIGLARRAIDYMSDESARRPELTGVVEHLRLDWAAQRDALLAAAEGRPACSNDELRVRANSLVLRATQAALVAAKGAGFVAGHPAGRWCQEALFFLVWSCPPAVAQANLCELAGIGE